DALSTRANALSDPGEDPSGHRGKHPSGDSSCLASSPGHQHGRAAGGRGRRQDPHPSLAYRFTQPHPVPRSASAPAPIVGVAYPLGVDPLKPALVPRPLAAAPPSHPARTPPAAASSASSSPRSRPDSPRRPSRPSARGTAYRPPRK